VGGFVKAEGIEGIVNFLRDAVEAGENPAVFEGLGFETVNTLRTLSPKTRREGGAGEKGTPLVPESETSEPEFWAS
jgi:hypothetical protein